LDFDMPKIVVIGSFNVDLITYVERMPKPGETVTDGEFQTMPGGKGSNQAVAAARLGAEVTYIGCVGKDAFAQIGFDLWRAAGINTQYVIQTDEAATGTALILVDATGENSIAVAPGANRKLTNSHVDAALEAIKAADMLIAQLEISFEAVEYAFKLANEHHIPTLLNPAPIHKEVNRILPLADYITPNEHEKATLGSLRPDQTLITTLGAQGAEWRRGNESRLVPTFKVEVVDTVGAGDAFNAGFAVATAEGKSLDEAVRFANAVAGLAVTKRGASTSPERAEVEAFLSKQA
jgi:ribokinase